MVGEKEKLPGKRINDENAQKFYDLIVIFIDKVNKKSF